jgi:SAM-dependent methyltransferase
MVDRDMRRVGGTEGYAESADALAEQYEGIAFADVHRGILHLLPAAPGRVLDIGAGTGRDAAALAALGHSVVAVEPTAELRAHGQRLHPSPRIARIDDALPDLDQVHERGELFDLIMLTAVWMHLDAAQRARALPRIAGLLRPGGLMALSLRHGPVPVGCRMFDVTADETCALARDAGLETVHRSERADMLGRADVTWSMLAFRRASEKSAAAT